MRANHVKRRLAAGEPSIGTWLGLPSPETAEFVSGLGFDWLVVDMEHNPIDIRTLSLMFTAMAHGQAAPMVRIPWNTPEHFKRVLDAGAWGVVVPMVNTQAEAELAAAAMRYPLLGTRSVGGRRHGTSFNAPEVHYFGHANDELLLVVQIEHISGVENADAILSVPGIDACFIGPNDLAASMGIGVKVPLESDHPELQAAIAAIGDACRRHGVAPGIHCSDASGVRRRIAEGFQFCALASEVYYMLTGLQADLADTGWNQSLAATVDRTTAEGGVSY